MSETAQLGPAPKSAGTRKPRRLSLKAQFVVLLCLAMGPAAVIGVVEAYGAFQRQLQKANDNLLQATMISALAERQIISGVQVLLEALAGQEGIATAERPTCARVMQTALGRSSQIERMLITDRAGRVVCTSHTAAADLEFSDRLWFQDAIAGQPFAVSSRLISRVTGAPALIAAVPLTGPSGEIAGTLSASVTLAVLNRELRPEPAAEGARVVLVDGEGEVLLEGDDDAAASQFPAPDALQPRVAAEGGVFDAAGQDGRRRTYAIVPVVQGRLAVLAAQPVRTLTMDRLDLWISVAVPLLIWLLAILTMWIGLERLVLRWLSYLQRVGAGYAGGHYIVMPHRVEDAPLEFRALGDTLSRMAQTARARQQELRSALEQKNVLVREIHHRVKNNLQIIQSLLNLQSRSAADSNQFTALAAAKSRINALALVHQSLYEDENLQYVNLRQFLNDLCRHLLQSGWGAAKRVGVRVDVPELSTTAEQAVPIALLVTEAVTNALKHAFFGRDAGTITVTMTNDPVAGGTLIIADNGIGMETVPKAAGRQAGQGIGYSLIEGFARQLRGQVQTTSENGTRVIVTFPYLKGRESTS